MVSKKFMKTPVSIFHSKANDFSLVIFSRVWMQYVIKVDFFFSLQIQLLLVLETNVTI